MPTIDADAHVIETTVTWEYMDKKDMRHQPVTVTTHDDEDIEEGRHKRRLEKISEIERQQHVPGSSGEVNQ